MIFDKLFGFFKRRAKRNEECLSLIAKYQNIIATLDTTLSQQRAVDPMEYMPIKQKTHELLAEYNRRDISYLQKSGHYNNLVNTRKTAILQYNNFESAMHKHNDAIWTISIPKAREDVGLVGGFQLDDQQMLSIVKNTHNHLILAGAGTGKSTTIIGKVKYILAQKKLRPEDILILSFTNASAAEMQEKISKEVGQPVDVATFHKLGLNILTSASKTKPSITHLQMHDFLRKNILDLMQKNDTYRRKIWRYVLNCGPHEESEFDFSSQEEYDQYLRLNPPTTYRGEVVKSYGEMLIANFLYQNKINYEYERQYDFDTSDETHGQYYPDFYLPDYNLWIEYFGVDKDGNVPAYWENTKEDYLQSMRWKDQCHKEHGTILLPCYAFQHFDGTLLSYLARCLESQKIPLQPLSSEDFIKKLSDDQKAVFDNLIDFSETIINLMKSNRYDINELRTASSATRAHRANRLIIDIVEPLFLSYQQYLEEHKEIDFNDMINKAIDVINEGKYTHNYSLVIVDEYQDISNARFNLLKAMRIQKDYDLFCVGDDWQSIYRFAGSDIDFILHFSKYWGPTEISKIETTYRFNQSLIDVSGAFIMHNPYQIAKDIKGATSAGFAVGEINAYTEKYAMEFTANRLNELPKDSSVYFIGRYSFDAKLLEEGEIFSCKYNNATGVVDVTYPKRPDLKMQFITAHKSKGLQADYVFIINNKDGRLGFPSQIQDAPILSLLLNNFDEFPQAEERRLYYVALTRARKKTFIVTLANRESSFVDEIKTRHERRLRREYFECPWCGMPLEKKNGPYGEFYGCSNYRVTGCRFTRKILHAKEKTEE